MNALKMLVLDIRENIIVAGVAVLTICVLSVTSQAATLLEDFDQGLSPQRWTVLQTSIAGVPCDPLGPPWTIEAPDSTGGIRISKPADTDPATNADIWVHSKFALDGDLSVWVDFDLHNFPDFTDDSEGWNEVGLMVGGFSSLRYTNPGQCAEGFYGQSPIGQIVDNTTTGRFGISREGQTMRAWIDRGGGPVLLGSLTSSDFAGPVYVALFVYQDPRLWGGTTRPHTAIDVSFDNLSIMAGSITPEPATLSLLALGGIVVMRRRRR